MPMMTMTCTAFSEALAAKESIPGGGSAAAYVGALGAALASMAVQFTLGKERYAAHESDLEAILARTDSIRERLVALVVADSLALEPLAVAYGIPKEDPGRAEILEKATREACAAPREMMTLACETIELTEQLCEMASPLLLSDVGCAAAMSRASLEAASLNITVNTATLLDRVVAEEMDGECEALLREYSPRAEAVVEAVRDRLSSPKGV